MVAKSLELETWITRPKHTDVKWLQKSKIAPMLVGSSGNKHYLVRTDLQAVFSLNGRHTCSFIDGCEDLEHKD